MQEPSWNERVETTEPRAVESELDARTGTSHAEAPSGTDAGSGADACAAVDDAP